MMRKSSIAAVAALCICLALLTTASSIDATATWNNAAHSYNFLRTDEVAPGSTFEEAWAPQGLGSFSADFAAIKSYVGSVCGSPIMDPEGDDVMSASLANW